MTTEQIDMTPNYDRIPLAERMGFQHELIEEMLGADFRLKPRIEQIQLEIEWAKKYAKRVSNIIDDVNNEEIRKLVLSSHYVEASILVLEILKNDNSVI